VCISGAQVILKLNKKIIVAEDFKVPSGSSLCLLFFPSKKEVWNFPLPAS